MSDIALIVVRIFFVGLIAVPILLGVVNFFKNRRSASEEKQAYFAALINSAVMFALAFNLIFFFQELFLVLGKKALGLTAYLYHNNHSWDGSHPMENLMQGSGALAIFVIGLLCVICLPLMRNSTSIWKLLLIWLGFNGLIQSVPQVMVAFFDKNTDVGQALVTYLQIDQPLLALLAIGSIVATALISIWFSRPLLELAPSEKVVAAPKLKISYMTYVGALASLLGTLFVIPFKVPPVALIIGPFVVWLFSIPWTWSIAGRIRDVTPVSSVANEKVHLMPIVLLLMLLAVFRFVLAPGIQF